MGKSYAKTNGYGWFIIREKKDGSCELYRKGELMGSGLARAEAPKQAQYILDRIHEIDSIR